MIAQTANIALISPSLSASVFATLPDAERLRQSIVASAYKLHGRPDGTIELAEPIVMTFPRGSVTLSAQDGKLVLEPTVTNTVQKTDEAERERVTPSHGRAR